jgi:hypothetical protein
MIRSPEPSLAVHDSATMVEPLGSSSEAEGAVSTRA